MISPKVVRLQHGFNDIFEIYLSFKTKGGLSNSKGLNLES